eukprot:3851068-Amphidinium_carterae.2
MNGRHRGVYGSGLSAWFSASYCPWRPYSSGRRRKYVDDMRLEAHELNFLGTLSDGYRSIKTTVTDLGADVQWKAKRNPTKEKLIQNFQTGTALLLTRSSSVGGPEKWRLTMFLATGRAPLAQVKCV